MRRLFLAAALFALACLPAAAQTIIVPGCTSGCTFSGSASFTGDVQIGNGKKVWSNNIGQEYLLLLNGGTNSTDLSVGTGGLRFFNAGNATAVVTVDNTGHLALPNGAAPTIASGACGTGTNGSIVGSDQSGQITVGAVATTACAVSFGSTFTAAPKACTFSAASAGSAAITVLPFISAISTVGFTLSGAVLANTVWYYTCF